MVSKDEYTLRTLVTTRKQKVSRTRTPAEWYAMSCVYEKHMKVSKTHKDVFFLLQAENAWMCFMKKHTSVFSNECFT